MKLYGERRKDNWGWGEHVRYILHKSKNTRNRILKMFKRRQRQENKKLCNNVE